MLFNSFEFIVFLPLVFIIYWLIGGERRNFQNIFLLASSYIFYGWWDWRFTILILLSSLLDFSLGLAIKKSESEKNRKIMLGLSLFFNLGLLGFFKYFNFFITEFSQMLGKVGLNADINTLSIILPVGISFYTFQTLSYTIDVYRRKLEPTNELVAFMAYVSFFPQLVAGPIERAKNLLPQFLKGRSFDYDLAKNGMKQILWGFFKKIVIADNCSIVVNLIFNQDSYAETHSLVLALGAVMFAFQIYGDFSGYSDIAIGLGKLFGIRLMKNFNFPYFSRDIAEFWRRWHISLSTWFKDYLYIPLGGSRGGQWMSLRNVFAIFLVSGFWHGANWTFLFWGFLNALFFLPLLLRKKNRDNITGIAEGRFFPRFGEFASILATFALTCFAWIFFRAESIGSAWSYIYELFTNISLPLGTAMGFFKGNTQIIQLAVTLLMVGFLLLVEWINRERNFGFDFSLPYKGTWIFAIAVFALCLIYGQFNNTEFIYFQF